VLFRSLGLAAATAGFNVLLEQSSLRDADSLLRQRADSERALVQVRNGKLKVPELGQDRLADSRVWIFTGATRLQAPPARAETQRAAVALANGPSRYQSLADSDERLFSLPVIVRGHRYGTIVSGVSQAPYEHTERLALIASTMFAAVLLLVVGVAVWWLLRSALRPVASMTEQAAAWSDSNMEGRFRLGKPHDELTRLAWTLDQLLDRISASLRHERLVSAELSHELRTPLAKLRAEAELALRRRREPDEYREALARVIEDADRIDEIVEVLLAAAKQESGPRGVAEAGAVARAAASACERLAETEGIRLEIAAPAAREVLVGVDAAFAERVLYPVLDNACRYARAFVHVSVERENGVVLFRVADDGPGVASEERDAIFEPATRGAAGRESGRGAGLGLPLARRLARTVAGDVQAPETDGGGFFVVSLPAA